MAKPVELEKCVCRGSRAEGLGSLLLFSLSAGCGLPPFSTDDVHGSQRAALAGQVVDAEFHREIANAGIYDAQTAQLLATTDSSGRYLIPSLLHRSYQLIARADRYEDQNFEVALHGTAQNQDVALFRLPCDTRGLAHDGSVAEDGDTSWVPGSFAALADCFAEEFCSQAGRCRSIYGAANLSATVLNYCNAQRLDTFFYKVPPDPEFAGHDGSFRVTGRDVRSTAVISYVYELGYDAYDGRVDLWSEETFLRIRMLPAQAHTQTGTIDCLQFDGQHHCADGSVWAGPEYGCIPTLPQPPNGGDDDCEQSDGVTGTSASAIRPICPRVLAPPDPVTGGDVRRIVP